MKRILILDDETEHPPLAADDPGALRLCGDAPPARSKKASACRNGADAMMLDVRLPDGSGIDFLKQFREKDTTTPAIMISGHGTIADAVEATRAGAFDFLEKPLSRDKVLLSLKNALEQSNLRRENEQLRELVGTGPRMIGATPAWLRVVEQATMAARSDARILLMGESGTGKELLAAHIHRREPVRRGPFVKVNCAAIPAELARERTVRPRERRVHRRDRRPQRQIRTGRRRALFSWTRSAICLPPRRPSCCACCRRASSTAWAASSPFTSRCASCRRPIAICRRWWRSRSFARTCTTGCAWCRFACRRCASGPQDIGAHGRIFPAGVLQPQQLPAEEARGRTCTRCCRPTPGPGNARELRNVVERMAILTPDDMLTADSVPMEIRHAKDTAPAVESEGDPGLGRARPHPAGAGGNQLERLGGGAGARDGAHQSA